MELLGTSAENDNLKIAMAGSSKRSVRDAYTRAKQWLKRRRSHHHTPSRTSDVVEEEEEEDEEVFDDSNTNDDSATDQFVDCNTRL